MKKRLVVYSADAMVGEDLEYLQTCPNFQKYLKNASRVKKVRSVYPTVTYPAHTSMSSGCYPDRHGIVSNLVFTTNPEDDIWQWDSSAIKVEDIFTAAKKKGYSTAAVFWPVTGNHKDIDYLINEYWIPNSEDTLETSMASQGSCPEVIEIGKQNEVYLPGTYTKTGRVNVAVHPAFDNFGMKCACDIIRKFKPEVLFIHTANLDGARHQHGVFGPKATNEIRRTDDYIGDIMEALKDAGVFEETNFVLVSDHGQLDLTRGVKPNVRFVEEGLIELDEKGKVKDWKAYSNSTGMSAQVYLKDPSDKEVYDKTWKVLKEMEAEGIYGFSQVLTKEEVSEKEHLSGDFSFVLETDDYTFFSDECEAPVACPKKLTDYRSGAATHGYLPDKGPQPIFLAAGPDFKENVLVQSCSLVDEAPTYARLLGTELPEADGNILYEILKQES